MPIKRRSAIPSKDAVFETPSDGKLHIVAKPKTPVPDNSALNAVYGDSAPRSLLLRFGQLAAKHGDTPDDHMTVKDRFTALRTPYDDKNPQEQRYRNRIKGRATAITAFCVICTGGRKGVTECAETQCPLWAFRFGSDPFYGKSKK